MLTRASLPLPRFRGFQAVERLASGGMAEVYRALSADEIAVEACLKRLKPRFRDNAAMRAMFYLEAGVTQRFRHEALVRAFDAGEGADGHFLLLEYVDGIDLHVLLERRQRALSAAQVAFIGARAARGLDYAHRLTDERGRPLGILHRDVSPTNILITRDGRVKVCDFGIARTTERPDEARTTPGQVKGKPGYMAPEQLELRPIGPRVDQFALGVVLFEALVGRTLFSTVKKELPLLSACKPRDTPPPSALVRGVPEALSKAIMRLCQPDPAARFPSCAEAARAFEQVLAAEPPPGRRLGRMVASWASVSEGAERPDTLVESRVATVPGRRRMTT